jgi:hypothetical protein
MFETGIGIEMIASEIGRAGIEMIALETGTVIGLIVHGTMIGIGMIVHESVIEIGMIVHGTGIGMVILGTGIGTTARMSGTLVGLATTIRAATETSQASVIKIHGMTGTTMPHAITTRATSGRTAATTRLDMTVGKATAWPPETAAVSTREPRVARRRAILLRTT